MDKASILAQLIVSISVISVWVFRYDNIVLEFKQYGISNLLRNIVGASKISLATILIFGIIIVTIMGNPNIRPYTKIYEDIQERGWLYYFAYSA